NDDAAAMPALRHDTGGTSVDVGRTMSSDDDRFRRIGWVDATRDILLRTTLPQRHPEAAGCDPLLSYLLAAIWSRLPHVSSKTAVVTGPISTGSCTKRTPRPWSRSNSAGTSSTANDVKGMPSATRASLNGGTAGWLLGSRTSSVPSGSPGETTVNQRASPIGISVFFSNPRISV